MHARRLRFLDHHTARSLGATAAYSPCSWHSRSTATDARTAAPAKSMRLPSRFPLNATCSSMSRLRFRRGRSISARMASGPEGRERGQAHELQPCQAFKHPRGAARTHWSSPCQAFKYLLFPVVSIPSSLGVADNTLGLFCPEILGSNPRGNKISFFCPLCFRAWTNRMRAPLGVHTCGGSSVQQHSNLPHRGVKTCRLLCTHRIKRSGCHCVTCYAFIIQTDRQISCWRCEPMDARTCAARCASVLYLSSLGYMHKPCAACSVSCISFSDTCVFQPMSCSIFNS